MTRGGAQVVPRPPDWRPGGPPAWAHLPAHARRITLNHLRAVVTAWPAPRKIPHEPEMSRPAGVLVPVFEEDGEAFVVLTRRSARLRNHSGEVSFPGGRVDDGETGLQAALREAHEEIGLHPSDVHIIGELDHLVTFTSKAGIMPFVGALAGRPTDLRANPDEVELVLTVPFSELLHDDTFHEEVWHFLGGDRPMYFFEVEGDTIWGATARILHDLLLGLTRNVRS